MKRKTRKLDAETYKNYKPPTSLFLGYIIGSVICISLLDILRQWLVYHDFGAWILNGIFRFAIFLIACVAILMLFWLFSCIFGYRSENIYRGIAFYRFINIISALCPLVATVSIILFNVFDLVINFHTFFNLVALVIEFFFPCIVRFIWYHKFVGIRKCPSCGLINTMRISNFSKTHLSTEYVLTRNYHIQEVKHEHASTTYTCSVCQGTDVDSSTT